MPLPVKMSAAHSLKENPSAFDPHAHHSSSRDMIDPRFGTCASCPLSSCATSCRCLSKCLQCTVSTATCLKRAACRSCPLVAVQHCWAWTLLSYRCVLTSHNNGNTTYTKQGIVALRMTGACHFGAAAKGGLTAGTARMWQCGTAGPGPCFPTGGCSQQVLNI